MRRVRATALLVVGGMGIAGIGVVAGRAQRAHSVPPVLTAAPALVGEVTPLDVAPPPVPEDRPQERPSRAIAAPRTTTTPAPRPRGGPLGSTVTIRSLSANGTASATGIVLDAAGRVLTNSHAIDGARAIRVQVGGVGPAYAASVVGRDVADDIAVLQLQNAPGMQPAVLGRSATVSVGQGVVVVGNAVGRGVLTATPGRVSATGQTITGEASDGRTQVLHGLIEVEAPVVKGDSGGPLLDGSGAVIGILTAGGSRSPNGKIRGYAVPIDTAVSAVRQIEATNGDAASTPVPQPAPAPGSGSPPPSTPEPSQRPPNVGVSEPVKTPLL